jgi:hypothetical protein
MKTKSLLLKFIQESGGDKIAQAIETKKEHSNLQTVKCFKKKLFIT